MASRSNPTRPEPIERPSFGARRRAMYMSSTSTRGSPASSTPTTFGGPCELRGCQGLIDQDLGNIGWPEEQPQDYPLRLSRPLIDRDRSTRKGLRHVANGFVHPFRWTAQLPPQQVSSGGSMEALFVGGPDRAYQKGWLGMVTVMELDHPRGS